MRTVLLPAIAEAVGPFQAMQALPLPWSSSGKASVVTMDRRKEGVLSIGKLHFRLASRLCRVHGGSNPVEMQPHYWPLRSAQHYNRYFAATEVLLIAHVLIGGKEHVEIRVLRFGQQFAVGERVPSSVFGLVTV